MKKFTFVMRCDSHEWRGSPDDSYTATVEANDRLEAAKLAKEELTREFAKNGDEAGKVYILIVFEGYPTIDGFGFQTGKYERPTEEA